MYKLVLSIVINTVFMTSLCFAQNPYPNVGYNLDYIVGNYGAGSPASTSSFGSASVIDSMGNYAVKQSVANFNNQAAYEYSLKNSALKTEIYFQKRQTNGFYTTLEEWQRQEKTKIRKNNGFLSREDIMYIYGR